MNLGHRPGLVLAVAGAITLGIVASLGYEVATGGQHSGPAMEREPIAAVEVCPSAMPWAADLAIAAEAMRERCIPAPTVHAGPCDGPPLLGWGQVRADVDQLGGWAAEVRPPYVDLVVRRDGSAVAYIAESSRTCTPAHVVGHLAGLGHSTRARSVMHPLCGASYDDVGGCP